MVSVDVRAYGNYGLAFLGMNVVYFIFAILACFGGPFGIIVGLVGIAMSIAGVFGTVTQNLRVLFIWIFVAFGEMIIALIEIFLLFAFYVNYNPVPYVGALGLLLLPPVGIYLNYVIRGKSFSWNGGSSINSNTAPPANNNA